MNKNNKISIPLNNSYSLVRWDLLKFEQQLCNSIKLVLPFKNYAIYFPQHHLPQHPEWLPEEQKLFLPFWYKDELLGVVMIRNPDPTLTEMLLPVLPGLTNLFLAQLELHKKAQLDFLTGLMTRQNFIQLLTEEIELIQSSLNNNIYGGVEETTHYKSSIAVIIIRFNGLSKLTHEISYSFVENIIADLADIFIQSIPNHTIPARTGEYEFALLIPETNRSQCDTITTKILFCLNQYKKPSPLTDRYIGISPYAGYAIYPQDMDRTKKVTMDTHVNLILHKAGLAAETAYSRLFHGGKNIMGYGSLLYEGGEICQILPLAQVSINLGREVGAYEGQHFSVWTTHYHNPKKLKENNLPLYKGEIVLLEVKETSSIAEIVYLGDPTQPFEIGDMLLLLDEEHSLLQEKPYEKQQKIKTHKLDPTTGLLQHFDFVTKFSESHRKYTQFSLAVIHTANKTLNSTSQEQINHYIKEIAVKCHLLNHNLNDNGLFGGRFALNSLIFFHTNTQPESLYAYYTALSTKISQELNITLGVGIAYWPFLTLQPLDILECCRKALEYALLLPPPHVGIFNSLAINISADKKHCRGDLFSAIEEYKLALLADKNNALAWNSLGVCIASLGHYNEAQKHFKEALELLPTEPMISYNLGMTYQSLGDITSATQHFHNCLTLCPTHLYAAIRLGALAESTNNTQEAIKYYNQALSIDKKHALPYRHLAMLAFKEGKKEKAREYLHQALLYNPHDTTTLMLMAKMYLDSGEDPEIAETLSRQCVAQRPDIKSNWIEFARALEAQGKKKEANKAWLKANEL